MIKKSKKTFYFSNKDWESIPVIIHQDLKSVKCVRVEVLGDSGWLILDSDTCSKTRFKSVNEREPTIVDFDVMVYQCPLGASTFTIGERC
jgi:hypothetical protein